MHSSLVMQDFETDSYWAIMTGESVAGKFKGTKLRELPLGQKAKWKDWLVKYPNTMVLSVNGREDAPAAYAGYFSSPDGFRDSVARDKRMETKEPIFAFRYNGKAYAVKQEALEGGQSFEINGAYVFMFRPKGASMFQSTIAFEARSDFEQRDGNWVSGDCRFDPDSGIFSGGANCPLRLTGFDTFWYNWSLNNPDTAVLE